MCLMHVVQSIYVHVFESFSRRVCYIRASEEHTEIL